jgi:hypothetical protein
MSGIADDIDASTSRLDDSSRRFLPGVGKGKRVFKLKPMATKYLVDEEDEEENKHKEKKRKWNKNALMEERLKRSRNYV